MLYILLRQNAWFEQVGCRLRHLNGFGPAGEATSCSRWSWEQSGSIAIDRRIEVLLASSRSLFGELRWVPYSDTHLIDDVLCHRFVISGGSQGAARPGEERQ